MFSGEGEPGLRMIKALDRRPSRRGVALLAIFTRGIVMPIFMAGTAFCPQPEKSLPCQVLWKSSFFYTKGLTVMAFRAVEAFVFSRKVEAGFLVIKRSRSKSSDRSVTAQMLFMTFIAGAICEAGMHAVLLVDKKANLCMAAETQRTADLRTPLMAFCTVGHSVESFMAAGEGSR